MDSSGPLGGTDNINFRLKSHDVSFVKTGDWNPENWPCVIMKRCILHQAAEIACIPSLSDRTMCHTSTATAVEEHLLCA